MPMTYSQRCPIKLIAGRFAFDFVNTPDWHDDGSVAHVKIAGAAGLKVWLDAVHMSDVLVNPTMSDMLLCARH
jgi:hypothetical protein